MVRYKNIKIFTGNANPDLASEITDYLGMELSHAQVGAFSDGEICLVHRRKRAGGRIAILSSLPVHRSTTI